MKLLILNKNISAGQLIEYYSCLREYKEPKKFIFFIISCNNNSFTHLYNGKLYVKFINKDDTINIL